MAKRAWLLLGTAAVLIASVGLAIFLSFAPLPPAPPDPLDDRVRDSPRQPAGSPQDPPGPESPGSSSGIRLEKVAEGFEKPVFLTHAGDGSNRIFVVEQTGRVILLANENVAGDRGKTRIPILDISEQISTRGGEQGLLGIAFSPDFPEDPRLYVSYTALDDASMLDRYPLIENEDGSLQADTTRRETLLRVPQPYRNHNGGMVAFDPDGYLVLGLGDGGGAGDPLGNGQNPNTLLGSLLRLDVRPSRGYAIPPDNPFVGGQGRDEIWAIGLRNPWRFSFDRKTGDLYIADVGQNRREEINVQPAGDPGGRNYGWNLREGTLTFREGSEPDDGLVAPVHEYENGPEGCSVTGGTVYRGRDLPALDGTYLFADYCSGTVWGMRRVDGTWTVEPLLSTHLRIASFGEDEQGEVYVLDHQGGAIFRLAPGEHPIPEVLRADTVPPSP